MRFILDKSKKWISEAYRNCFKFSFSYQPTSVRLVSLLWMFFKANRNCLEIHDPFLIVLSSIPPWSDKLTSKSKLIYHMKTLTLIYTKCLFPVCFSAFKMENCTQAFNEQCTHFCNLFFLCFFSDYHYWNICLLNLILKCAFYIFSFLFLFLVIHFFFLNKSIELHGLGGKPSPLPQIVWEKLLYSNLLMAVTV